MSSNMVIKAAQESLYRGTESLFKTLPLAIRTIIEERLWAERLDKNGVPFSSFEAFVTARLWHGLEVKDIATLRSYLREDPDVVRLVDGEMGALGEVGSPTGANQYTSNADNISIAHSRKFGTDPTYLLARMKRDAPEVAQDYLDGKHKSIRAAAIVAGIIKVPSNYEQAIKAVGKLTPDELLMLKEYLGA